MNHPLATYISTDGSVQDEILEQLAFNEKMAEIGRLSAGMIHELNTPLSVIVSAAQMILREHELPEFVREMVERIDQEAQRLSHFTRGLLTFSRREEGERGEADINHILREVMAFLRYEAQKRSVTVVEEFDFHLASVAADGNRLKQVFINLVMNALQAMGEGGTLLLRSAMAAPDLVEVAIADTGCGIPPHVLPSIFTPFFTTKGPGEGTGLGLFITKKLVELDGGTISVRSVPGEGTTFNLTFPIL